MAMPVEYSVWKHETQVWGVKIDAGKFHGTVISINDIGFVDDTPEVTVDFNFINIAPETDPEGSDKLEFDAVLGSIIEDIIKQAIQNHEAGNTDSK